MEKDTKKLFQITEASHACGLSRSTLMQHGEKRDCLRLPILQRRVGEGTTTTMMWHAFCRLKNSRVWGLLQSRSADYFAQGGEISTLLATLESRLQDIQRNVEELRLRTMEAPGISVQISGSLL